MHTETTKSFNKKYYAPMILSSIMNPINSSIIAVALLPISRALGVSPKDTAWLVSALYLTTAIGQPVCGKLIDLYGPKKLFLASAVLVLIGSSLIINANQLSWLIIARILIGLGTCAGYPSSMYLIKLEAERTGQASPASVLAMLAFANQSIVVVGPLLGGFLIQYFGWKSAFLVNFPLALACLVLGALFYPKTKISINKNSRIDATGILLFSVGMIPLLLFLMDISSSKFYLLLLSLVCIVLFLFQELRMRENAFIDIALFKGNKPLLLTYLRTILTSTIAYSFLYSFSQWLQDGRGLAASAAGSITIPLAVVALLTVAVTGKNPKIFSKMLVGSLGFLAAGFLQLFMHADSSILFLCILTGVCGIPQGLNNLANQNILYYQSDTDYLASLTGILKTFQYLGAIFSSAINGAFLSTGATTHNMHSLALFQIGIAVCLMLLIVTDKSIKKTENNLN